MHRVIIKVSRIIGKEIKNSILPPPPPLKKKNTTVLLLNHIKTKILVNIWLKDTKAVSENITIKNIRSNHQENGGGEGCGHICHAQTQYLAALLCI